MISELLLQYHSLTQSGINTDERSLVVVDNFYKDPTGIRNYTINSFNFEPSQWHKGQRSHEKLIVEGTKERFEEILGRKVTNWEYNYNGVFQFCTAQDPLVYHCDTQQYAGVVFLTPNAPPESGTSFYRSRLTGKTRFEKWENNGTPDYDITFQNGNYYDKTKLELIDKIGNVYNRLAIWDARTIHAANEYFGDNKFNSRYFHMFFFDCDKA
jgi:hypothetical protein